MASTTNSPGAEHDDELAVEERPKVKRPRRFQVVFHNDDYTTMEFVVMVLVKYFHKTETEATQLMLTIHHKGRAIAGTYTRDVAETKVEQVMTQAKRYGHPLRCTAEPESDDDDDE